MVKPVLTLLCIVTVRARTVAVQCKSFVPGYMVDQNKAYITMHSAFDFAAAATVVLGHKQDQE